ncbi:MAG: chromosome segregation SMC family protein [Nitrososphaerota archaeon]
MVYIKKLTIQGFKSFESKKTTIELERGLVVITGPNGGGKSNILDAIRFALGELSSHNLRVGRMSELINDKNSTSGARVSLTLDNSDRVLPVDSDEVTITRRLDKTGESQYLLNGREVSRTELLTILSMANIRPSGFNIVAQGSVTSIAEMSPVELRKMLEEIAGIGEYERKKEEAEEQLQIAEKNIAIAKAGTSEVKLRVYQLQLERNQAYRRRNIETLLSSIKQLKLQKTFNTITSELREVEEELSRIELELSKIQNNREEYLRLQNSCSEEWNETSIIAASLEEKLKNLERVLEELRRKELTLTSEKSSLSERLRYIHMEIQSIEENLRKLDEDSKEISRKLDEERSRLSSLEELLRDVYEKREEVRKRLEKLKNILKVKESNVEETVRRETSLKKEIELIKMRLEELQSNLSKIENEINVSVNEISRNLKRTLMKRKIIKDNAEILQKLSEELSRKHEEYTKISERFSKLIELQEAFGNIISKINSTNFFGKVRREERIEEILKDVKGVYGFLDSWLEVDDIEVWGKLEAGTCGWIHSLVVDSWKTAIHLAEIFSNVGIELKILPLEIVEKRKERLEINGVKFKAEWVGDVLSFLLGKTYFSKKPHLPKNNISKIVYGKGVTILKDGRIEIYPISSRSKYILIKHEYEESLRILDKLKKKVDELSNLSEYLKSEIQRISNEILKVRYEIESEEKLSEELLNNVSKNFVKLVGLEIEKLITLKHISKQEKILEELLEQSRNINLSDMNEIQEIREEIGLLEEEYIKSSTEIARLEMEKKRINSTLNQLTQKLVENNTRHETLSKQLSNKKAEAEYIEKKLSELSETSEELKSRFEECRREIEATNVELENKKRKLEEISKMKYEFENELRKIEQEYYDLSSKRINLVVKRSQLEVELKKILEEIDGKQLQDLPEIPHPLLQKLEEELLNELKELDKVNQLAPQQYEELVENYKVRSARIRELEEERAEIIRFMKWLEGEKKRVFLQTFNKVSEKFEHYFSILTGGQAWLKLEDEENIFEKGVEIIVRFPGKSPRSARGASGGEKSVTAVALLLALQGLTPADFYIFDEVDAHMDIQYSARLAELFEEMSKKTQIIVITLKDVIAEKADQLIGVYMRDGASRIVKTKIEEVLSNG